MSNKKQTLGKVIHEYRLRMNWTQAELAFNAGISRAQMGRIERDECTPTIGTIDRLAESFCIPKAFLLEFIQDETSLPESVQAIDGALRRFQQAVVTNMTDSQVQHVSEALDAISSTINR